MVDQRLRYNFFFNKTKRMIHVVPEGKTGGPNSIAFGDYKLEVGDQRTYAEYKPELLEQLEIAMNTIPDEDFARYDVRILNWDDEVEVIEATEPVVEDPIEPDLPVPVSGEIRAEAYGLTDDEEGE